MTYYAPNADTIRKEINSVAEGVVESLFLTDYYGSTLDGSDVAAYMKIIGFDVVSYKDTGRCGLVTLTNGVLVSTNGCAIRAPRDYIVTLNVNGENQQYTVEANNAHNAHQNAINAFYQEHPKGYLDKVEVVYIDQLEQPQ